MQLYEINVIQQLTIDIIINTPLYVKENKFLNCCRLEMGINAWYTDVNLTHAGVKLDYNW